MNDAPYVGRPDLRIQLDRTARLSLTEQIRLSISRAIESGLLTPGTRLPSWQGLATHLGVARGTVQAAYERLSDSQMIETFGALGTRVAGVKLYCGDLREPQSFAATAGAADGVVHAASTNDASPAAADEAAAIAMLSHLHPGAVFVYTSGTWVYGNTEGKLATVTSALDPTPLIAWRPAVEQCVQALAANRSIAAVILRPAMVHGYGGGIFGMLAGMVRQTGSVRLVGNGRNHWPAVHVDDLATVYLSAVEQAASGDGRVTGQVFNVVAEDAVAVAEMGDTIRASVGADRVELWSLDDARKTLGPFADALALDQTVSGRQARRVLAWEPHGPGLITDLSAQNHFQPINGV